MAGVGTPPSLTAAVPTNSDYAAALDTLDIAGLEADLTALMTDSQACWPADGGHYGGLMIRLAWHCSGTYRAGDSRGGCEGGRLRFPPESNWMDNANLEHARALLVPIKQKYGDALSWGDLMTFAGTVAIRSMGGPTLPACFGRTDEPDGSLSAIFGTTEKWDETTCEVQGNCQLPLGAITVGLIYVNPEGPLNDPTNSSSGQNPDPVASATEIREVFGRMGMNDTETAALVAGGHAFGRCHGPCANPPCGNGIGANAFTSGFEGPWTTTPSQWSYEFVTGSLDEAWEKVPAPAGAVQWRTVDRSSALAGTMRLTADLAFVNDADYRAILMNWMANPTELDNDFKAAWNKLTTQGTTWTNGYKCEAGAETNPGVSGPIFTGGAAESSISSLFLFALIVTKVVF